MNKADGIFRLARLDSLSKVANRYEEITQPLLKVKSLNQQQHAQPFERRGTRSLHTERGGAMGLARILRERLQLLCKVVKYSPVGPELHPPLLRLIFLLVSFGTVCLNLTVNKKSIINKSLIRKNVVSETALATTLLSFHRISMFLHHHHVASNVDARIAMVSGQTGALHLACYHSLDALLVVDRLEL
jgi:hypothetical protein